MVFQGCSPSLLYKVARNHLATTLTISGLKWIIIARHVLNWSADLALLISMADIIRAALLFPLICH